MKDKKYCKVVQDLLPNYIENLTNEETNQFIEEHLKECSECKKIYENMKEQLSGEEEKANKKEVNYLKKYNIKLRIFMGIVLAIILIFVIGFVRKLIIFNNLQDNFSRYSNSTNYYFKATNYSEGQLIINKYFRKDDKYMLSMQQLVSRQDMASMNDSILKIYGNMQTEEETEYYSTSNDGTIINKIPKQGGWVAPKIPDVFEWDKENIGRYLKMVLFSSVTSETCNGKDCYKITKREVNPHVTRESYEYIEKQTGLWIRTISDANYIMDYKYTFGGITDQTIVEPEVTEIEENE